MMKFLRLFLAPLLFFAPIDAQEVEKPQETAPIIIEEPVEEPISQPLSPPKPLERVETFGYSVEKRPLIAHIFGDGPNRTLIIACVHGNEWATPGVARLLRQHLLKHPEILQGRQVIIIPVVNPDGLQRKSRRNARNVDINRNYPGTWRRPKRGEGFAPGPSPASEPETQAMMRLVAQYPPKKIVSIHQPLNCMAYSGARSKPLAREMQKHNRFRIAEGVGYPTPGGFGGYCNNILKVPVVTLELPWQSPEAGWKKHASALLAAIRFEAR
jgi:protein MpaA